MSPVLFLSVLTVVSSVKLPSNWETCKRNDPKVEACMKKAAQIILNDLVFNGNKELEVPPLDPFRFEKMDLKQGQGSVSINISFIDLDVLGISNIVIDSVKWDWEKQHLQVLCHNTGGFSFFGKYNMKGKVLLLPLTGTGAANLTTVGAKTVMDFYLKLENKNGKSHLKIIDSKMDSKVVRMFIHFTDLFNGDKALGNQMNNFLNENWQLIMDDIGAGAIQALIGAISSILNRVFSKVPVDQFFPAS